MIQDAPDHPPRTNRQSGLLTGLNMTVDFRISHIEGAVMADDLALGFEFCRIVSAVWTAEAQISRVVTINRDTGAFKENAVGRLDRGRKHRLVRGGDAHRADNVIGLVRRPDSTAGSNRWIVIGGNGDLVP